MVVLVRRCIILVLILKPRGFNVRFLTLDVVYQRSGVIEKIKIKFACIIEKIFFQYFCKSFFSLGLSGVSQRTLLDAIGDKADILILGWISGGFLNSRHIRCIQAEVKTRQKYSGDYQTAIPLVEAVISLGLVRITKLDAVIVRSYDINGWLEVLRRGF